MTISIRGASARDRAQCIEMLNTLGAATGSGHRPFSEAVFEQLVSGERGAVALAEEAGLTLGMVTVSYNLALRYDGEYCQLEELVVLPQARGKRLGGLLLQHAIDAARARGCADMGLYLIESTTHNQPFYEKFGFIAVGAEMRQRLSTTLLDNTFPSNGSNEPAG